MKSNKKAGAGEFSAVAGTTTIAAITSGTTFNKWYSNTSYGTSYRDVTVTLTNSDYTIQTGESVVIKIAGTTNSVYIESYSITYTPSSSSCTTPTFTIGDKTISMDEASNIYDMSSGLSISKDGSTGEITYSCADGNVEIDGSSFYTETAGTYTVTATMAAAGDYCAATTTFTITVTAKALDPLATPKGLAEADITATTATLSWNAVENATKYRVTIGDNSYETTSPSYAATGLTAETAYSWTVTAIGDNSTYGDSKESSTKNFTTAALPKYTITWSSNGGTYATSTVTQGEKVTLPSGTPTPCSTTYSKFVGWYTSAAGNESSPSTTAPSTQVTAETVPTGNVTYYAVFSDATGSGSLEKATSLSNGDVVYLATSATGSGVTGANNNKDATVSTTQSDWMAFTVVGSTSSFTLKNSAGNYVTGGDGTFNLTTSGTELAFNSDGYFTFSITKGTYALFHRPGTTVYIRCYKVANINKEGYNQMFIFKSGTAASGYISSCCTPERAISLSLNGTGLNDGKISIGESGEAVVDFITKFTKGSDNDGTWSFSCNKEGSGATVNQSDKTCTFSAAGTYTITANYDDNTACKPTAVTATITVTATPTINISQSDALNITIPCGSATKNQTVTLSGYNLTAGIKVASDNDAIKVATAANGTYGASATYAASNKKVDTPLYIQITAPAESDETISGKLTFTSTGAETKTLTVNAAVSCQQYKLSFDANGGKGNAPDSKQCYGGSTVTLPEQGSMTAPANKVFVGWNTDKNATTALDNFTMPASDATLYAIWRAANYQISCGDVNITTQVGKTGNATVAITLNDETSVTAAVSGTNEKMFSANVSGGSLSVTFNGSTSAGTYTATVTLAGTLGGTCTVTLTATVNKLATLVWAPVSYCYDDSSNPNLKINLNEFLYKDGEIISSNTDDFSKNLTLLDETTGSNIKFGTTDKAISTINEGVPTVTVAYGALTLGHTYRLTFTNAAGLTDGKGTLYTNATCEFTIKNCNSVTMMPPCPVTTTGFTAKWETTNTCTDDKTLSVYQKEETEIANEVFTATTTFTGGQVYQSSKIEDGVWGAATNSSPSTDTYGVKMSVALYSPTFTTWESNLATTDEMTVAVKAYNETSNSQTLTISVVAAANGTNPTKKSVTINGASAEEIKSSSIASNSYGEFTFTLSGVSASDRFYFKQSGRSEKFRLTSVTIKTLSKSNEKNTTINCSVGNAAITGLKAGETYYYTLGDGAEQKVTTRSAAQEIDFDQAKLSIQSDDGVCATGTVPVAGTNVAACLDDISLALSGSDASLFSVDRSALTYDVTTGTLGGSVAVTYCPGTARGTHTDTLTLTAGGTDYTLDLEGISCNNYTPNDPTVGATYAIANLGSAMSGVVSVTDMTGENVLNNPGFETDATTGWTSSKMVDHAFTVALDTDVKHSGNNSVKVTGNGSNWKLAEKQNVSCLFSNNLSLDGDYALSFYVRVTASEEFYFGLADEDGNLVEKTKTYKSVSTTGQWIQLSASFTDLSGNYILFIGRRTTSSNVLYIDDVSLLQTSTGSAETFNFSGTTATMSDLWPGHSYSYTIKDSGTDCEYGPFMFTTGDSTLTPDINVETPITISCQAGQTASTMVLVETDWITTNVDINKPTDGGCGKFSLSTTSIQSAGGSFWVTFTPGADVAGQSFKCTLTLSGSGSTGNGTESVSKPVEINGVVSAGADPSTPMIEVVDIDTTMMTVEHNIEGVDNVEIKLSREMNPDEIKLNVGCELFFSKYYEASRDVKLWAIYNPTNDVISLKDTYVWVGTKEWRPKYTLCDLQYMGRKEQGKIYPKEEIIVYASDGWGKVLTCAATKADMSGWYGMNPQGTSALSFDGNDALCLVRAETNERFTGKTYQTNEFKQYKYQIDGRDTTFNWRYIVMPLYHKDVKDGVVQQTIISAGDSVRFQMLDLIGARKSSNQPDNSKCKTPAFNKNESGDEKGWVSKTGKDMNGNDYPNPNGVYDVLSTNRCLLVRSKEVKAGSAAITKNQGDFYTLATEWQGAYVPQKSNSEDEAQTSCDNFSYVGGFDYANYYSAYTSLSEDEYHFGLVKVDSTYKTSDFKMLTDYTCQKLLIECVVYEHIGGIDVRSVKASTEYKVPIIVNKVTTTADKTIFKYSNDTCKECDVVILANKRLTHADDAQWHTFRDMKVFPGGNFYVGTGKKFDLRNLEMQAKNDTVSYAKIDGSLTVSGDLVHEKRIDSKNWYCFSLPYDCNLTSVRQLNGKSLGQYGTDWWIQYYDGAERAEKGTWNEAGTGYNGASYWKTFKGTETLKANVAYLVGIGGINESSVRYKTIYFPPAGQNGSYTESSPDTKSVSVEAHVGASVSKGHENDRGWNFIGNPYISIFNQSGNNNGVNSSDKLFFGHWNGTNYDTKDKIYVNVPDGKGKYVQNEASSIQLFPFKGYFIQVAGSANTTLEFAKGQRVLQVAEAPSSELHADVILQIVDTAGNNDVAGILVDEDYTDSYEVARDLTKMGSTTLDGPQLWTYITDGTRQRLAFNALPAASAKRIPLSIYAPKAGDYTLSINRMQSDLSGVTAVTLYYGGTAVANLLDGDFTVTTNRRATDNDYSITVERVAQVTTPINNNLSDAAAPIVVISNGQVSVEQLPASGRLMVVDAVGRQIWSHALDGSATCSLQHLPAGVYMIVVDGNNQRYLLRTIVK